MQIFTSKHLILSNISARIPTNPTMAKTKHKIPFKQQQIVTVNLEDISAIKNSLFLTLCGHYLSPLLPRHPLVALSPSSRRTNTPPSVVVCAEEIKYYITTKLKVRDGVPEAKSWSACREFVIPFKSTPDRSFAYLRQTKAGESKAYLSAHKQTLQKRIFIHA